MKLMLVMVLVLNCLCTASGQTANSPQAANPTKPAAPERRRPPAHHRKFLESKTHPGYFDCEWQSDTKPGKLCVISIEWLANMPLQHDPIWLDHNDTVIWITTDDTPFRFEPFVGEDCGTYEPTDNGYPFDKHFDADTYSTLKQAHFTGKKNACWEHMIDVGDRSYLKHHTHKANEPDRSTKQKIDPHIFGGSDGT